MTTEIYRLQLGDFECFIVQDANFTDSADKFFTNTDPTERDELLTSAGYDPKSMALSYNCLVVKTHSQTILIDAGGGDEGRLLTHLATLGISPADIDTVVLSHGHGDHYGGFTDSDSHLIFTKANHLVWRDEWFHWTNKDFLKKMDEDAPARAEAIRGRLIPIQTQQKMTFISPENAQIAPGLTVIYAPGHTPHHIAVLIESLGNSLLYVGDAFVHPFHGMRLDWGFGNDSDATLARETRIKLLTLAHEKSALLLSYHFEFPGLAMVARQDGAWQVNPVPLAAS